jgi:superfamily I DNA/RNA helicase
MQWYVPFNRLSNAQRRVLDNITSQLEKCHWVQGFAGTGKTVLVTHLMERVAADKPNASICFVTFTHALKDLVASGLYGAVAKRVVIKTANQFVSDGNSFDYVFLDEVQDIKPGELSKIKSLASNFYVAGDSDQRIYSGGASESDISSTLRPSVWKLLEIFRLTSLLKDVAVAIFPKASIIEGNQALKAAEVSIKLARFGDEDDEVEWVWREALGRARPQDPSVILLPTHRAIADFAKRLADALGIDDPPRVVKDVKGRQDYAPFNEHWANEDVPLEYLGSSFGSLPNSDTRPLVYLMTFHSSKGLDFENVFIPYMLPSATIVNEKALKDDPDLARRLLFVAVTRSRRNLFISYSGAAPHPYVTGLPSAVVTEVEPQFTGQHDSEDFF